MSKVLARRTVATGLSSVAILAMMGASPAVADVPWAGALCKAAENIQFYNSSGAKSYVVQAHEYIRVVYVYNSYWAYGHGEGHSDRDFVWQHSNGIDRLYNCHNT